MTTTHKFPSQAVEVHVVEVGGQDKPGVRTEGHVADGLVAEEHFHHFKAGLQSSNTGCKVISWCTNIVKAGTDV